MINYLKKSRKRLAHCLHGENIKRLSLIMSHHMGPTNIFFLIKRLHFTEVIIVASVIFRHNMYIHIHTHTYRGAHLEKKRVFQSYAALLGMPEENVRNYYWLWGHTYWKWQKVNWSQNAKHLRRNKSLFIQNSHLIPVLGLSMLCKNQLHVDWRHDITYRSTCCSGKGDIMM